MIDDTQIEPQEETDLSPASPPSPLSPVAAAQSGESSADGAPVVPPAPAGPLPATPSVAATPALPPAGGQEDEPDETSPGPPPVPGGDEGGTSTQTSTSPVASPAVPPTPAAPPLPLETVVESAPGDPREGYWQRILTGNPASVPADIRSLAGADDDSLEQEEQDYRMFGTINRSWVVDHCGLDKESVQGNWKDCRAGLADALGVADDEHEVFMGLSAREEDKPRREAGRRIFEQAYLAGLKGEEEYDIHEIRDSLDTTDHDAADTLGEDAYQQGFLTRQRWMPLVEQIARAVDAFSGMEEDFLSAPRVLAAMPDFAQAIDSLAGLGEEDRETVLYLAAELARSRRPDAGAEGLPSRLVRAARRGAGNVGMGVLQALNHAGIVTLSNIGGRLGGETGGKLEQTAADWDRRLVMAERLRGLAWQEIAPLYPADSAHRAESYLIDAAEATPAAMLAFCGGAGFAALAAAGMGESVTAARSLNPQGDHELQLAAGILGGAVQGAIYMGMSRLGGRMLEQSISNFMKSRGAGMGTFVFNSLKSAGALSLHGAELITAGKLARAADLGSQELGARLSGTASNIDWRRFGDNLTDIEANMREAAATLPFLLIGSGRVALRHFRSPRAVLGEGYALREWGIDDATRESIMNESNIDIQSEMLRDALRGSRRWSAPGFMKDIVLAMNLFNGDYFKGFKDLECVRDFLDLPAERSLIEIPVKDTSALSVPKLMAQEGHVKSRDIPAEIFTRRNFLECLRHWDEIYRKSHVWANTPRLQEHNLRIDNSSVMDDRMLSYFDVLDANVPTVPYRMHNSGIYNPNGESERRALLRDRVQECLDLSQQFVLCTYSLDSLVNNVFPVGRNDVHMEKTRNRILGYTATAVLNMAAGESPSACMRKLTKNISQYCVRRSYRGSPPDWLRRTQFKDFYHLGELIPEYGSALRTMTPDFRNVLRVVNGLKACALSLRHLLPMTSDFHTALSRGMSPLQAFNHLLVRELGFDPGKVPGYPTERVNESATPANLELFAAKNRQAFEISRSLWGEGLEQAVGEDGTTHWRARRPDGAFTRWHASENDAINDLALGMETYFGELGRGLELWIDAGSRGDKLDFGELPHAPYSQFSGFDQLASVALQDLNRYWYGSATRTQPGWMPTKIRTIMSTQSIQDPLQAQAGDKKAEVRNGDVAVELQSMLNPVAVLNARINVFWNRLMNSGVVSAQEVGDFLVGRGYLDAGRCKEIIDISRALPFPRLRSVPLCLTPPPDVAGMNREMAREMARFQSLCYLATLSERRLPGSVVGWFRMASFCPDMPEEDYAGKNHRVRSGPDGLESFAWANRYAAMSLKKASAEVESMRRMLAENPLPADGVGRFFSAAVGESEPHRCEQGWCYQLCGPGVFRSTPQKHWNMLLYPMRGWEVLSSEEKDDVRERVGDFCRREPAREALDALGRHESPDYVDCAFRQLDRVLQRFPDLHRYAPVEEEPGVLRVIALEDDVPGHDPLAEPESAPIPLRWQDDMEANYSISRVRSIPEELRDDEEAMSSLRFLDCLRRAAMDRPYVLNDTVWWRGKPYGGSHGTPPKGLEDWEPVEPLENLFHLLHQVDSLCKQDGVESLVVCGVPLRGAGWRREDFAELSATTVYRYPGNSARSYRLMPGYPESPNLNVSTPYVVSCQNGAYVNGAHVIRGAEEMQDSFCRLEKFKPATRRDYSAEHLEEWRNLSLEGILDAIESRAAYAEATHNPASGIVGMGELLLRFCEDTGFSLSLDSRWPSRLDLEQAHIVNIASAMLECMQSGNSEQAMSRLVAAVRPLRRNPDLRTQVLKTLHKSSDSAAKQTDLRQEVLRQLEFNWDTLDFGGPALETQAPRKRGGNRKVHRSTGKDES